MIAMMDQLTVIGRRSIAKDLLVALQSLGVVQVDPLETSEDMLERLKLSSEDQQAKEDWTAIVTRTDYLLGLLGVDESAGRTEVPSKLDDIKTQLASIGKQVDQLVAERDTLRDDLDIVGVYLPLLRDLAPSLAQFDDSRYLTATAFSITADKLEASLATIEEALESRVVFQTRPRGKDMLVIAAALRKDRDILRAAISRTGLAEISLPENYAKEGIAKASHLMEERSQSIPKRLNVISEELRKLAAQHGSKLRTMHQTALNQQSRLERLEDMAAGRYGFALRGWMPAAERNKVVEGLRKQFGEELIIEARAADEHHDHNVPVKLDNPQWIKPFEGLLSLFAPPKYGNFDPSWTLALFFPFFFGLIVGDIGFGLMFLALGLWLRSRGLNGNKLSLGPLGIVIPATALPSIGTVINWCAAWTMVWGFLYGEFFGNLLEKWPASNPIFYPTYSDKYFGVIPIAIFRVHESGYGFVLTLCIAFGALQVLGGWAIRAYYGYKHHDKKHLWEGIGMFAGLLGIIVFAYSLLNNGSDFAAIPTIVWAFFALMMIIFFIAVVISGVVLMPVELISNSGNILSYLRLFAVGLSAALIATLVTDLGYAIGGSLPIIGPLLGIVLAFFIHLIALVLKIISYTLQPLRLQYVEFFTKFGFYEESGRPYKPFRLFGGKA